MPTPYGSRGGMAFSADELRVLRGALAVALQSSPASTPEVRETLQLAEALDEALREGRRFRSFLLADLARYRAALPGSAVGYLEQLDDALAAGYLPRPDDLAALRTLCGEHVGPAEGARRTELLARSERLAEQAVRARLLVLPGGRSAPADPPLPVVPVAGSASEGEENDGGEEPDESEKQPPQKEPEPRKREPGKEPSKPSRPIPTPGEVFPPRRRQPPPTREALPA